MEFEYLGDFSKNHLKTLTIGNFEADFEVGERDIDFWTSITKDYVMLEGNHDERVRRFVKQMPMFEGLIEPENRYQAIRTGKVRYVSMLQQPYKRGKLNFVHGWSGSKFAAKWHLERFHGNIVFGHGHVFQQFPVVLLDQGEEIQAWEIGCLSEQQPEWKKGLPTGWQKGFGVVEMDKVSGDFNFYPVNVIKGRFFFEGKEWR
jgi:hypothetical protein